MWVSCYNIISKGYKYEYCFEDNKENRYIIKYEKIEFYKIYREDEIC